MAIGDFDSQSAERIVNTVRTVGRTPTPSLGSSNSFRGIEEGFYAVLTDLDTISAKYSWAVVLFNSDGTVTHRPDLGSGSWTSSEGFAVELTGANCCIIGDVVWMMPSQDQPFYTFQYPAKAKQAQAVSSTQAQVGTQVVNVSNYLGIIPSGQGAVTIRWQVAWPSFWVWEYIKCQSKTINFPHCPCLDTAPNKACWWSSCTATISGVSDPPPPPDAECWNTCTLFNQTVNAAKLSGYACSFGGSIQKNFGPPPCYDVVYSDGSYAHEFHYYTVEVLIGANCGASSPGTNLQPGQAYFGFSCRIDLKEYFDGLVYVNGQWIREMIGLPLSRTIYMDNVSRIVTCGQPFTLTAPIVNSSNNSFAPTPCTTTGTPTVTLSFS